MDDELEWMLQKLKGISLGPQPTSIGSMGPGQSWINPSYPGSAQFVHEAEQVRPRGISLHQREDPVLEEYAQTLQGGGTIESWGLGWGGRGQPPSSEEYRHLLQPGEIDPPDQGEDRGLEPAPPPRQITDPLERAVDEADRQWHMDLMHYELGYDRPQPQTEAEAQEEEDEVQRRQGKEVSKEWMQRGEADRQRQRLREKGLGERSQSFEEGGVAEDGDLRTHDGYPARRNPDGSYSTEVTVTLTHPRLNEGRPTNVPSLWGGEELDDEDEIVDRVLRSGKIYPYHRSIEDAEKSARNRSESGGASPRDMEQNFRFGGMIREDDDEEDPALIRKPFDPDEEWEGESSGREDPSEMGTPRHPNLGERPDTEEPETPSPFPPDYVPEPYQKRAPLPKMHYQEGGTVPDELADYDQDLRERQTESQRVPGLVSTIPSWLLPKKPPVYTPRDVYPDEERARQQPLGQESWQREPLPTTWPTQREVAEARQYKQKYDNPNEKQIEPYYGTNVFRGRGDLSTAGEFQEWALGNKDFKPTREQYGDTSAGRLYASQLAANVNPVAALGFDPEAMAISRAEDKPGMGIARGITMGLKESRGDYRTRYPIYAHLAGDVSSTPVHEAIHRGIALVLDDPSNSDLAKRMEKYDRYDLDDKGKREYFNSGNEYATRALMLRHYGNVESFGYLDRPVHPQIAHAEYLMKNDPQFVQLLNDIQQRAAHMGAQRLIKKQGMVYAKGGMVTTKTPRKTFKVKTTAKRRMRSFEKGGVQMAEAGDIRTGRELGQVGEDANQQYESLGYLNDRSDEQIRREEAERVWSAPTWDVITKDKRDTSPSPYRGDFQIWRKSRPTS